MKVNYHLLTFIAFVAIVFSACANAQTSLTEQIKVGDQISGKVIKVLDGDTYDLLLEDKSQIRIRMEGIDAPEGGMPYYRVAKDTLSRMCYGQNVTAHITDKDDYKRFIALTYTGDGRELSSEMIKNGLAWHYKKFNADKELAQLEASAQIQNLNIWSEKDPVPPWIIRKAKWQGVKYKHLRLFRERSKEYSSVKTELKDRGVHLKVEKVNGDTLLQVFSDGQYLQAIDGIAFERKPSFHLADYNMDGNIDILISYADGYLVYYLYESEVKRYERRPDWNLHIWKLNTTEKQILTYPEGTIYEGKVRVYEIGENGRPEVVKIVDYK